MENTGADDKYNKRPYLFKLSSYAGFVYYGLISLVFLIALTALAFNNQLVRLYSEQYGIIKEGLLINSIATFLLYVLSLFSTIFIWFGNRKAIYLLAISTILIFVLQLFSTSINWVNILISSIIVITALYYTKNKGRDQ